MTDKFFLDSDNDCHWYVVPDEKREAWDEWVDLDEDDPRGWTAPSWAERINGPVSQIRFSDWEYDE